MAAGVFLNRAHSRNGVRTLIDANSAGCPLAGGGDRHGTFFEEEGPESTQQARYRTAKATRLDSRPRLCDGVVVRVLSRATSRKLGTGWPGAVAIAVPSSKKKDRNQRSKPTPNAFALHTASQHSRASRTAITKWSSASAVRSHSGDRILRKR